MRHLRPIGLALAHVSILLAGCDALKALTQPLPATSPAVSSSAAPVANPAQTAADLQAALQSSLKQSVALTQSAALGTITNGPVSFLKQSAAFNISSLNVQGVGDRFVGISTTSASVSVYVGEIWTRNGGLVASGSATASPNANPPSMDVDMVVATASVLATASNTPNLVGARIKGTLTYSAATPVGLKGAVHIIQNGADTLVDFGVVKDPAGFAWQVTAPIGQSDGSSLFAHLYIRPDHTGSGWVSTNRSGSPVLSNCVTSNGRWINSPVTNPDATSSFDIP